MSSFGYLLLFGKILFVFISSINAVSLDITCENDAVCGGTGAICSNGKCQCDTPWYTPCNTTACNLKHAFVYEGDDCRNDVNCLNNTVCDGTPKRCVCKPDFTSNNGLCYKNLNSPCKTSLECWPGECRDDVCKCGLGFKPKGDNRGCERQLAKIYANWTYANSSGDFCYDTDLNSCRALFAICQSDSIHSEKFCQCPSTHTINNEQCELIKYSGLSPSVTPLPEKGCGKCEVKNALCVFVANQTTCWCRAGFIKKNECDVNRKKFIFPNANDISTSKYASPNCSTYGDNGTIKEYNGLCTCAPGYIFINRTVPCQPIQLKWQNDNFEYDVCTRINFNGTSIGENGLCPAPLKCEARQDKHVCSCGRDKYPDEQTKSCYYFLERTLTTANSGDCPPNSTFTASQCQCSPNGIYISSTNKKRCELKLIESNPLCTTSNSTGDIECEKLYGGYARFCKPGECRCLSDSSYYNNNTCVTLLNVDRGTNGICPQNTRNGTSPCTCDDGYRADKTNHACVQKVDRLNKSISSMPEGSEYNLTNADCIALFPNQPVNVSSSNDTCVCDAEAFIQDNSCVFYIDNPSLPSDPTRIKCPANANFLSTGVCKCDPGYTTENNETCERITDTVYPHNYTTGTNIAGIKDEDCKVLFGLATEATKDDGYCRCADESVAFFDETKNKCYFLPDTPQSVVPSTSDCPPNSEAGEKICKCSVGYQAISPQQACERKPIYSSNLQPIDINILTSCNAPYTNADCEVLHGVGAVCSNGTCYCNRSRSFVQNNQCVLYSKYVFPGIHERDSYTCDSEVDCGTDADKNGIECGFLNNNEQNYKLCKCKPDYSLNPVDSTCVKSQCDRPCSENEECQNSQCICKVGFYRNPSQQCVKYDIESNLYDLCNLTLWNTLTPVDEGYSCSPSCERIQCTSGYHDDKTKCVKNSFTDSCGHNPNLCSELSHGAECNLDDNKCRCSSGYYQEENTCVRPVDARCQTNEECGIHKICIGQLCQCDEETKAVDTQDAFGRVIQRCINGIDQIRFNSILFLFIILARIFFG